MTSSLPGHLAIAADCDCLSANELSLNADDAIAWLAPTMADDYAEYYDESFLKLLGLDDLKVEIREFWPRSGPRWDGLVRTRSARVILLEAKAYTEEGVDYRSHAEGHVTFQSVCEVFLKELVDAAIGTQSPIFFSPAEFIATNLSRDRLRKLRELQAPNPFVRRKSPAAKLEDISG